MVKNHSNLTVGPGLEEPQVFLEVEPINQPTSGQGQLWITVDQRIELRVDSDRAVSLAAGFIAALDSAEAAQNSRGVQCFPNQKGGTL